MHTNRTHSRKSLFEGPINQFSLNVPDDYEPESWLVKQYEKIKSDAAIFELPENFNDLVSEKASHQLLAGGKYTITFYPLVDEATSEDCIDFLLERNAVLTGPLGLLVLFEMHRNEFPIGKWSLSFDYPEYLQKNFNYQAMVLSVEHKADEWGFAFGQIETKWRPPGCIICFELA